MACLARLNREDSRFNTLLQDIQLAQAGASGYKEKARVRWAKLLEEYSPNFEREAIEDAIDLVQQRTGIRLSDRWQNIIQD